ncbi:Nucleoporin [Lachnellula suecica]|uniref:Nucleoporin n=1 Tax=Lachnellula suecica TaxID=602035 RepID=A0A8T9C862_9HELO|nr:Nucleoporin [Lachnellula suecica]
MTICKFWQQGSCKFGDRCRFEHPPRGGGGTSNGNSNGNYSNGNYSNNNYSNGNYSNSNSTNRNNGSQNQQGGGKFNPRIHSSSNANATTASPALPFALDKLQIITDLSSERPQWILSAYGPGRHAPAQLFGGPREQSFEEMRLAHYMAAASGNPQQAAQEADRLFNEADQQIQTALRDVDGAMNFIINAQHEHPNRVDIVALTGSQPNPLSQPNGAQNTTPNSFGAPSQGASSAFGAPSQPRTTSAFGAPSQPAASAFGAPSGGGAFGQPSALGTQSRAFGAPSGGAFGQPTALGTQPSAFGAPSQPASGGAFGQPSQLGGGGAFGRPSQLGAAGGVFGQPASLGQKTSAFGAPSSNSTFGGTSNTTPAPFSGFATTANPFSQNTPATTGAFAAPSQPTTSAPFGGPSPPAQANPFGTPSGQTSNPFAGASAAPFGAPSPAPNNPFAAPSPAPNNPFGASSQPTNQNPFGGARLQNPPVPASSAPNAPNPFNSPQPNPPISNPFGNAAAAQNPGISQLGINGNTAATPHPPISSYSSKDQNGRLTMFKGRRVVYQNGVPGVQNNDRTWSKIWFPEGAPLPYKDTEMEDSAYDDGTKAAYGQMRQTGSFTNGVMPMLPPKREWCTWDF